MEGFNEKIVEFEKYCTRCKNKDVTPTSEPCNECLGTPARIGTHKPLKFEEKKENNK